MSALLVAKKCRHLLVLRMASFCLIIVAGDCSPQRSPSYGTCWEALSSL